MSEKPKTTIVKVEAKDYAILKLGEERRRELAEEYLELGTMSERDLPSAQFPGSGSVQFTIPSPAGDEYVDEINGVIIGTTERRRWYDGPYKPGANDPPKCSSNDMETGVGHPAGDCHTCSLAKWGSKDPVNGDGKGAQACGHRRILVLIQPDKLLPFIVDLPPTALKNALAYLRFLLNGNLRRHEVITSISLSKPPKAEWTETLFHHTVIGDPEIVKQLDEVRRTYAPLLEQMRSNASITRDSEPIKQPTDKEAEETEEASPVNVVGPSERKRTIATDVA